MSLKATAAVVLLASLLVCSQVQSTLAAQCPAPYDMEAGVCIATITQHYDWCSANDQCALIGGQLVNAYESIKKVRNMSSVASCSYPCGLWVGLSDLAVVRNRSKDGWQAVNGNGILPTDSSLWTPHDPDNDNNEESCLVMRKAGLADTKCSGKHGFLCEYSPKLTSDGDRVATWQLTPFERTNIINGSLQYCYTDVTGPTTLLKCTEAAFNFNANGRVCRHLLYNSQLGLCRLMLHTDAQVELEIRMSGDWKKYSIQ